MPVISVNALKEAVIAGKIGGISIDTSVFEQYEFGFETGVLAQMVQFSRLDIDHFVFDTVLHEITNHLVKEADLTKAHLKNALKPLSNSWAFATVQNRTGPMLSIFCCNTLF
ncbi:hypothetical protein ACCD04_09520 [Telluria sp. Tellsp131]|uniref:hypothetical protein n=1 Tax=Massilia sp. CT11-108 TaxID=3393900 RepID=UPI0039A76308